MAENPSYYSILPANVRYDNRLKANEKILYSEITALANKNGYCYATNEYFASLYDVSKRNISRWINGLIECNYIKVELIYKKDSKEVEERRIYIAHPIFEGTPMTKLSIGSGQNGLGGNDKNVQGGGDKNVQENNTRYLNNTSMNILRDDEEKIISKVKESWNSLNENIPRIQAINPGTKRFKDLMDRVNEVGLDKVLETIGLIDRSKFLQGFSPKSDFVIKFDWFVKADNFNKVLEGNYTDTACKGRAKASDDGFSARARRERMNRVISLREC